MSTCSPEACFDLARAGLALTSRDTGASLREELLRFEEKAPQDQVIRIIIPDGVPITPSFVDEFFGRLVAARGIDAFKAKFSISTTVPATRTLVNMVVRNRIALDARATTQ